MSAWLELAAVIGLAVAGVSAGRRIGRGKWWWLGFLSSMVVVIILIVARRSVSWSFVPPMSWVGSPKIGPIVMGAAVSTMLTGLAVRLPELRKRVVVFLLMCAMLSYFALLPVVAPLAARAGLLARETTMDRDGVCLQQHSYSCGPAAVVTCLGRLGVKANEGELAVAAWTAPALGTDERMLVNAVQELHKVRCEYRYVGNVDQLQMPAVVAIWSPKYGGHYLSVLEVHADYLDVGDPLCGKYRMSRDEFLRMWRQTAVEFPRP